MRADMGGGAARVFGIGQRHGFSSGGCGRDASDGKAIASA